MSRYRNRAASRRAGHKGREKRLLRQGGRVSYPEPVARCAGCVADIYAGAPTFRGPGGTYCSADCITRGRHWVDPRMCGGCHGEHPFGVRPE